MLLFLGYWKLLISYLLNKGEDTLTEMRQYSWVFRGLIGSQGEGKGGDFR